MINVDISPRYQGRARFQVQYQHWRLLCFIMLSLPYTQIPRTGLEPAFNGLEIRCLIH